MTGGDRNARQENYHRRLKAWVGTATDAIDYVSTLPGTDRHRIAVLGFSQGAFVAVGVAGTDDRVQGRTDERSALSCDVLG